VGGQVHFLLGSNFGSLIAAFAQRLLRVAAGAHASLTIVSFADAEFNPNAVHIVRADWSTTAIVGSSNLTLRGLGQNVEAGVIFDARASDSSAQMDRIRTAIDYWRDVASNAAMHPQVAPAVFHIKDDDDLRDLVERGIINLPHPKRFRREERK
jgi:phosphatidylserine/phosphatidylglycerophosphate/cardiolipin synthase-like enzyme